MLRGIRLALLAKLTLATAPLAGCRRDASDVASTAIAPPSAASALREGDLAVSARRPARRYYMTHVARGCEVTFVDAAATSPIIEAPCPVDLLLGERIRIAGKTCTRESADPSRELPVVCPDPLTNLEKRERGELAPTR